MGFWIFILIMNLLFPAIMILFGSIFIKSAPKSINPIFGYRTSMSMKNNDTWEFAHKYIGRLWLIIGIVLLPITIIPMLLCLGKSEDTIGNIGYIICIISLVAMIIPIIPTELALKKHFDKSGNRK